MKQYVFILISFDGFEIDRTIVNANNRKEAINHVYPFYRGNGRKFRCFKNK